MKIRPLTAMLGLLVLFSVIGAACTEVLVPKATPAPVDGYVAVAPRVLRAGQTEGIPISLFSGQRPARGEVSFSLLKDGRSVAEASGPIDGSGVISLPVPQVPEGEYRLQVNGPGFQDETSLRVEEGTILFLETDKPIYKPGQRILMRVLTLDPELKPLTAAVTIEVQDAKGIKVFKSTEQTDEFGMATVEMPLSTEPNLGVWKVTARSGKRGVRPAQVRGKHRPSQRLATGQRSDYRYDRGGIQLWQTGTGRGGDRSLSLRGYLGEVRHVYPGSGRPDILRAEAGRLRGGSVSKGEPMFSEQPAMSK